jgi:hypothetical protein
MLPTDVYRAALNSRPFPLALITQSECPLCDRLHLRQYLKKSGHSSHKPFGLAQEILRDCEFAAFLL